jgi:hypothetical protein
VPRDLPTSAAIFAAAKLEIEVFFMRGRKPTPLHLRLIAGNPGKRPLPQPRTDIPEIPGGPIERPENLKGIPGKLWDRYIVRCHWLTWADGPKALMWCHLQAEYERKPAEMIASRIAQLRAVGSDLGLDVTARDRLGITIPTGRQAADPDNKSPPSSPASKYF